MAKVKLLVMDVDGTMTDGCIYMGADGEVLKSFSVQDGYGIVHILPELGILPVVMTGRRSQIVERRAGELKIKHLYQGVADKLDLLKKLAAELQIAPEEIAFIGDDLIDMDCIRYCGVTACPADAVPEVLAEVNYICRRGGGKGAVREFIDWLKKTN